MTISHFERHLFTFRVASEREHTELASPIEFAALDRLAWKYIRNRQCARARTKR
jgi:hypothetical protein